mmetsp:Transcript_48335/g.114146  ORF Transcript_48335/g.114146 Transcript_48335/m.114146 type:complete len:215 (-) Transcript_48335:997-1641(-)
MRSWILSRFPVIGSLFAVSSWYPAWIPTFCASEPCSTWSTTTVWPCFDKCSPTRASSSCPVLTLARISRSMIASYWLPFMRSNVNCTFSSGMPCVITFIHSCTGFLYTSRTGNSRGVGVSGPSPISRRMSPGEMPSTLAAGPSGLRWSITTSPSELVTNEIPHVTPYRFTMYFFCGAILRAWSTMGFSMSGGAILSALGSTLAWSTWPRRMLQV